MRLGTHKNRGITGGYANFIDQPQPYPVSIHPLDHSKKNFIEDISLRNTTRVRKLVRRLSHDGISADKL
jgi:hypothetical protein